MMNVNKIKNILSGLLGKRVKLIYFGSRNKKEVYCGYIYKLYRNVFVIKNELNDTKCFSYVDILTKSLKIIY